MIVLKFNRYFIPIQEDKKSQVPKHDMIGLINTERPAFKTRRFLSTNGKTFQFNNQYKYGRSS
jgi:hypothetical protein